MNSTPSVSVRESFAKAPSHANPVRFFYVTAASVLLVVTAIGFQQFYLHGKAFPNEEILPAARPVIIAHGVAMTAWILLFLAQTGLITAGRRRLHMTVGVAGAMLAAAIVVLGPWAAILAARFGPERLRFGLNQHQFLIIPFASIVLFGAFVGIGLWNRRRPAIHRPMMLLATLSIMGAPVARIGALKPLYAEAWGGRTFGPYFIPLLLGILFLAVNGTLSRSFDRWHTFGAVAQAAAWALTIQLATTASWGHVASWLLG